MTTADEPPHGKCRRSDCPVASGGQQCALDHDDLIECPQFEPDEGPSASAMTGTAETSGPIDVRGRNPVIVGGDSTFIYSGDALTVEEATAVLRGRPATLVVPFGPVKVGKSTLLGSMWEHIASLPTDDWIFAESLTPYGFEARCYLASFDSGLDKPEQAHTSKSSERLFLHVALHLPGADERRDLLFADVSGEHASQFIEADEPGPLLALLRSAHLVAVLVDGAELAQPSTRWAVVNEARTLIRVMLERVELRPAARFIVVVTKWDKCAAVDDIEDVMARLATELAAITPQVRIIRTAARSEDDDVEEGTGLAELLSLTLEETLRAPAASSPPQPATTRRLGKFVAGGAVLSHLARADQP